MVMLTSNTKAFINKEQYGKKKKSKVKRKTNGKVYSKNKNN